MSESPLAPEHADAGELFRALASPIRVALVSELAAGEQCVHELVETLGLPQPLVSQHLRVLRGADLVEGVRRGREVAYRVTDEHVAHIVLDAVKHAREVHVHERHPAADDDTGHDADPTRTGTRS